MEICLDRQLDIDMSPDIFAAWYITHARWACLIYVSFIIWCLWTTPTIWWLILNFTIFLYISCRHYGVGSAIFHDAALGLDSEGWCLHLHAALNEAWCLILSFETRLGSFGGICWLCVSHCLLLEICGLQSWLLVTYLHKVRCWCGCWILTPDTRYVLYVYFSMGSAPFGRCCDSITQTIFNGAWCRLLSLKWGWVLAAS